MALRARRCCPSSPDEHDGDGSAELVLESRLWPLSLRLGIAAWLVEVGTNSYFMSILAKEQQPRFEFDYINYSKAARISSVKLSVGLP